MASRGGFWSLWEENQSAHLWKKANQGDQGAVDQSVYLAHGKMLEEIIKQIIYEPLEYSAEISNSQQGFVKNKSCQTHLISSYDRAISLVERQWISYILAQWGFWHGLAPPSLDAKEKAAHHELLPLVSPLCGGRHRVPRGVFVNPFGMGERGQGVSKGGEVGSQGFNMLMAGGGDSWRKGEAAQ